MRDAMTGYRKISSINWKVVHRGSDAFGKHSARSCRVGTRASIVPLSFFSTRLYAFLHAYMYIRPLSRLHTQTTCTRFMHEFPSN